MRGTIATFGLTLAARPGVAEPRDEPVRFDYRAPAGCPDAEAFATRVRERTARARVGEPGELARTFVVDVRTDDGGATARLSFTDSRGAPVVRSVRGQTCDEVVQAIALVTALAIEAGPPVASEEIPVLAPTPPASVPPRETAASEPKSNERAVRAPEPDVLAWLVGVEAGMTTWLGPSPNLGIGLFGELGAYAGASARITLLVSTSHELVPLDDSTARRADFRAFVARAEGCPLAVALGSGFRLVPCLGLGLGQLEGRGDDETVELQNDSRIFWADLVPALRLDWTVSDSLVFFAEGELGLPLVRHKFIFEGPIDEVFEVPAVGAGATFGMAWRFE